jgi:hypothetical protein
MRHAKRLGLNSIASLLPAYGRSYAMTEERHIRKANEILLSITGQEGGSPRINWYFLRNRIADALALPLPVQESVPEGWKLVPIEPTDEMVKAGRDVEPLHSTSADVYRAILASSPSPTEGQTVKEEQP